MCLWEGGLVQRRCTLVPTSAMLTFSAREELEGTWRLRDKWASKTVSDRRGGGFWGLSVIGYTEIKLYYRTTLPCDATRRRSSVCKSKVKLN